MKEFKIGPVCEDNERVRGASVCVNTPGRYPVARYAEVLTFFLSCESDVVSLVIFFTRAGR